MTDRITRESHSILAGIAAFNAEAGDFRALEELNAPKSESAQEPAPAQDKTDWLNEAIQYAGNHEYATVAAMIAIAQELRRLNDREQMSNHTGPWLVDEGISALLDKATK